MSVSSSGPPGFILVVCTANICRSPMAAALLAQRFAGWSTGSSVAVASGGFLDSGRAADPFAVAAMATRGIDLRGHLSTQLQPTLLRSADLVITMTGAHVQQAVDLDTKVWPRTFRLTDLSARIAALGPRPTNESLGQYIARLHSGRTAAALMGAGTDGDIADPFGGPPSAFERTAVLLDQYVGQVALAVLGLASHAGPDETAGPGIGRTRETRPETRTDTPELRRGLFRRY